MRRSPRRLLLVGTLALILPVCGGGGSGGGSPVAPPQPPPGPPPDTSQVSNDTLLGAVIGLFDPAGNFAGSTVQLAGVGSDTVRSDNTFRIEGVLPGDHVLTVSGAGHLKRQVEIEMLAGGANEIAELDLAESGSFDLAAFNEIYRQDGEGGTARMMRRPHFKVSKRDFDSLPGSSGSALLADIEAEITGQLKQAVRPFLNGVRITHKDSIRKYESSCDVDEGDIAIYAERNLKNEDGDLLWGWAWWCWWPELQRIRGGLIVLDDEAATGTVAHEAIHILGGADHLESNPGRSIIGAPYSRSNLSPMDEQHLRFLYHRPPGLMSPDDARGLWTGDLTRLGSGGAGMEVSCQLFADGTARIEYLYGSRSVR